MTDGGKALAAARYKEEAAQEAKERMSAGGGDKKSKHAKSGVVSVPPPIEKAGKARNVAGQKYGVSGKMVDWQMRSIPDPGLIGRLGISPIKRVDR